MCTWFEDNCAIDKIFVQDATRRYIRVANLRTGRRVFANFRRLYVFLPTYLYLRYSRHAGLASDVKIPNHTTNPLQLSTLKSTCVLAWLGSLNFIVPQVKFNRFLLSNEHTQGIFWYFLRQFEWELSNIGHFQSSESIFEAKY